MKRINTISLLLLLLLVITSCDNTYCPDYYHLEIDAPSLQQSNGYYNIK